MEYKMTPWFVNGEKPARPGVYNVSCRRTRQSGKWYAYWNGDFWVFGFEKTPRAAWKKRDMPKRSIIMSDTCSSWRGLAEPAK